jgi:hypothetical protein
VSVDDQLGDLVVVVRDHLLVEEGLERQVGQHGPEPAGVAFANSVLTSRNA